MCTHESRRRILIVDDNQDIHEDFENVLGGEAGGAASSGLVADFLGQAAEEASPGVQYEMGHAFQGEEAVAEVQRALRDDRPYLLAFVDMRMPPGFDGLETIRRMWAEDPSLQVVVCTAYSDYSWEDIARELQSTDSLLILKKPFDATEVKQLASALTEKRLLAEQASLKMDEIARRVEERTRELKTANEELRLEIAERERAERALRESEEYFRSLWDSIRAGILLVDPETHHIVDVNSFAAGLIGVEEGEICGRLCHGYVCPAEVGKCPITDLGQTVDFSERVLLTADSKRIPILKSVVPVRRNGHRYLLETFVDITERKQLEEQVLQTQRMQSIGTLASGVAHNFNNILGIILGNAELLNMAVDEGHEAAKFAKRIVGATDRAARLSRQLLSIARRESEETSQIDVRSLVEEIAQSMDTMLDSNIVVHSHVDPSTPALTGVRAEIEQVLMNVCLNARDAMPKGGNLTIKAGPIDLSPDFCETRSQMLPGEHVRISVSDTGTGIDAAARARIFDPFFTTKEPGKGTGLGLTTAYGTITRHKGAIEMDTDVGKGTTFRIYLPAIREEGHEEKAPPNLVHGTGAETILIVDDERSIVAVASRILEKLSYRIIAACNGAEAVEIYRRERRLIDLVLLDYIMPTMDGEDTLLELRRINPSVKVVMASGYDLTTEGMGGAERPIDGFVGKPYRAGELSQAVRQALDG